MSTHLCILRAVAQMQPSAQRVPELPKSGQCIKASIYTYSTVSCIPLINYLQQIHNGMNFSSSAFEE